MSKVRKPISYAGQWWYIPLIPALGRQRQLDLSEFKASLVHRVSSRTVKATQRNPILKNERERERKKERERTNLLSVQIERLQL